MARHVQARAKRDAAPLDGDAYRAASQEIASIEVGIAALEEPPPKVTAPEAAAPEAAAPEAAAPGAAAPEVPIST